MLVHNDVMNLNFHPELLQSAQEFTLKLSFVSLRFSFGTYIL